MLLNNNKQTKYFTLNTNDKTETTKWNIPTNYNFSQKAKIALVSTNNATDSNLNFVFCPTIKNNYYSSLNNSPLIYAGIGYDNKNIINGKQFYDVNGAYLNEIELKTFSSPPQNDFSYPELDGLKPNLWLKFDTGAITTNDGTNAITLTNNGTTPNAGVSVRGNNSVSFNGTTQYLSGTIEGFSNNSFSVSAWIYSKTGALNKGAVFGLGADIYLGFGIVGTANAYRFGLGANSSTSLFFLGDINNWVHITWVYNSITMERMIYRNGVKLIIDYPIAPAQIYPFTTFRIGSFYNSYYYNGYVDDLRVYTGKVLTQEEINSIYNNSVYNQNVITRLCTSTNDNTTESINFNSRYPILAVSRTNEPFYNSMKAYQSLNVPSNFLQKGYIEFEVEYPNSSYDITTEEFKNSNFSLVITDEDNEQVSDNNIVDFKN